MFKSVFPLHTVLLTSALLFPHVVLITLAHAQVEPPDRKFLFQEDRTEDDREKARKLELRQRKRLAEARQAAGGDLPFDITAKSLSFDSVNNKLIADGNVLVSYSSLLAEAMRGEVDVRTNVAKLEGNVRITDITSDITADSANISLETGEGALYGADIIFAEGDYRLSAKHVKRAEGEVYTLKDVEFTTCACPQGDSCPPWAIAASDAEITREGYGFAWNSRLKVLDVPVFYWPFLVFPAKSERQTGFLPATFGTGRQSGFSVELPFFWAMGPSTDSTITGLYESEVRSGVDTEFRTIFSRRHTLNFGVIYANESARKGQLLGTDINGLNDPELDENRVGAYVKQSWSGDLGPVPLKFFLNGAYVSDDLFIREIEKREIAPYNSRFVTSSALLRAPIAGGYSADLSAEFNQAIVDDDDFVFQRLPELTAGGISSFRPFGENQFGLKLVTSTNASFVNFTRKESYEGSRAELVEKFGFPFNVRNYLDGLLEVSGRGSLYNLRENKFPISAASVDNGTMAEDGEAEENGESEEEAMQMFGEFPSSSNRFVPEINFRLGSVVEKVFSLGSENVLRKIGELGRLGRGHSLERVKHTIEPIVKYKYVPDVDQSDNPQFDSLDRLAERNVVTYGVTQRILGRYLPRDPYIYGIEEIAPRVSDIGNLRSRRPLDRELSFGFEPPADPSEFRALRRGAITELARLSLSQSYDLNAEDNSNSNFETDSTSDLDADLLLFPNEYVRLRARADYDVNDSMFSAYTLEGQFTSARGDSLRNRFRSVDQQLRQLETSAELKITDFLKLGYYSRYDSLNSEFIEQKGGIRISSKCRCWVFDLDVTDKSNPNETKFAFNITLVGLG